MKLAETPEPPYYAVIFASLRSASDEKEYSQMAEAMLELARQQAGFLGVDSARNDVGITVSYWRDEDSIARWKANIDHAEARLRGRTSFYQAFTVRVAKVERAYSFGTNE